jgi:chemotaxis protein MotA
MNVNIIIGFLVAVLSIIFGFYFDGGSFASLYSPTSILIVLGGALGYILLGFPLNVLTQFPRSIKFILFRKKKDYAGLIDKLYNLANIARREGILSMEAEAEKIDDPFIKKGLLYVADGVEPEFLKEVLENETAKVCDAGGAVCPAMGLIGTVIGMVNILLNLTADMSVLGISVGTAFLTTFYGVFLANVFFLPLASHIRLCAEEEASYMQLIVTGLLSILEGEYPARMRDNLIAEIGGPEKLKPPREQKSA